MAKVNPIQVQKFLKGLDYPASKQEVLKKAEEHKADDNVREALEALPEQQFDTPTDISKALGESD